MSNSVRLDPPALLRALGERDLVPFVGSGLSTAAGLPTWEQLVKPLASLTGVKWPHEPDYITSELLLRIMQQFEDEMGRHELLQRILNQLQDALQPTENHRLLFRLPIDEIYTTNWDRLLEHAAAHAKRPYRAIIRNTDIAYSSSRRTNIIKLAGDVEDPTTMLVTSDDFYEMPAVKEPMLRMLQQAIESKTLLFVGHSARDPFVASGLMTAVMGLGRNTRRHYMLTFEKPSKLLGIVGSSVHQLVLPLEGGTKSDALQRWLRHVTGRL